MANPANVARPTTDAVAAAAAHPSLQPASPGAGVTTSSWPFDPTVACISTLDHTRGVDPGRFRDAVVRAERHGARLVRTGALGSAAMAVAVSCGFRVIDELVLLRAPIDAIPMGDRRGIRALSRRHHRLASRIDVAAFGPLWGFDADAIAHARRATRTAWAATVRDPAGLDGVGGYAVCGVADEVGYLQRVAVHPSCARRGHGRRLVTSAAAWCHRHRCSSMLVNTGVDNDPARALYEDLGFVDTGGRLWVLEWVPPR